jgi:hypothetical protein
VTWIARIREIGPEHLRLATVLDEASQKEPAAVPSVLDLVALKPTLPSWMTAPADLEAQTKTREVVHARPAMQGPRWIPWQARQTSSNVPSTPASSTVQSVFSVPPRGSAPLSNVRDPSAVFRNTPYFAKELLKRTFLFWYWGLYVFLKFIGLDFFSSFLIAVFFLASISLTYGFIRAQQLANSALSSKAMSTGNLPPPPPPTWHRGTISPSIVTIPESIIGNAALSIFHRKDCEWVRLISPKNLIRFSSAVEAAAAGYKACQVCSGIS